MAAIALDKQARDDLSRHLTRHLKDKFGLEVGTFECMDLLDFLSRTLGPYFYNQGLHDAQAVIRARAEGIVEAVEALERPPNR